MHFNTSAKGEVYLPELHSSANKFPKNSLTKYHFIARISFLAIMILFLSASVLPATEVQGQTLDNVNITLTTNEFSLKELFNQIEKQTACKLIYNDTDINRERPVRIKKRNNRLKDLLESVLAERGLEYKQFGSNIIIRKTDDSNSGTGTAKSAGTQQNEITGHVTGEDGNPIAGVSVKVRNTGIVTMTDLNGNYRLRYAYTKETQLSFTSVGYKPVELPVPKDGVVNVVLATLVNGLNEVVVVAYGTQSRRNLTGSVTSINSAFLANRPLTNASQALQGVTGLYVNQAGGQPGKDAATIQIRGVGTLNDNSPLVLVNGIEYDLKDVNPSDIESVSVLKDAASASIYGSRAANGVVLVTTKTGKQGRNQIEYNGYTGWQQATYLPDVVTSSVDYMNARNLASKNENQPAVFTNQDIEAYRSGTDPDLYPNTNWYDLMFRTAPMNEHNVRASGGNEKVTYSVSLGYLDQEGVLAETNTKKYSVSSNLNFNFSKRFKAGLNFSGSYRDTHEPAEGAGTLIGNISRALPNQAAVFQNGNYADQRFLVPGHNVFRNPYAKAREGGLDTKSQRALVNAFAEYKFPFDIVYKINAAVTKYDAFIAKFVPEINLYSPLNTDSVSSVLRYDDPSVRSASRHDYNNLNTSFFQTLGWNHSIGEDHHVNLLLGFSRESFSNSDFGAYIEGFLGNELTELNAGTTNKDVSGTSSKSTLMSYFGRAGYNYLDKYLLEFNFRYDGSSRFANGNRWGFFPSVAGAWRISSEPFLKDITAISDLKLRASWGKLGNQNVPLYSYLNSVDISQGYSFHNSVVSGAAVTSLSDPGISWESTAIRNLGLDLTLWNGELGVIADFYDKKTSDILARINVPAQVGDLNGPVTNLYTMSNRGLEISLTHTKTVGEIKYNVGAGIALLRNRVDYLNGDVQYSGDGSLYAIKEGFPVNSYYLYVAEGLFQTQEEVQAHANEGSAVAPGDIKYKDLNGDGVIGSDDRIITGRTVPKYTYNFNLGLSYKGFDLSALFQGVEGVDLYPKNNLAFPLFNGAGLTKDELENSWTPENPNAKYPRLGEPKRGSGLNYKNSTFWLKDGSYLRLKNILLAYNISEKLTKAANLKSAKVFVSAQNPLTFSKYKLTDPERNIMQNDISEYPSVKTFTIGMNIIF